MYITRVTQVSDELVEAFERLIPQLTGRQPPSRDELAAMIDSPCVLLIARHPDPDSRIVGSGTLAVFRTPTGGHAHIEDVIVDQAARRSGIGRALVSQLLVIADGLGLEGVSLTCNPARGPANELYEKMGFTRWETNVYWYGLGN